MRTRKENIISYGLTTLCTVGLLTIYGWLVHEASTAEAEVAALQKVVDELKEGNAELEQRNIELYADFCQEAEWLQECQLSIQSLEAEDKLSVENIDKIIGVHK